MPSWSSTTYNVLWFSSENHRPGFAESDDVVVSFTSLPPWRTHLGDPNAGLDLCVVVVAALGGGGGWCLMVVVVRWCSVGVGGSAFAAAGRL